MALFDFTFFDGTFLKESMRVHCVNAWCSTGHLLAQTCIGLLIISPVLDKLRMFLIEPSKEEISQAQDRMTAVWSSFAESTEQEKFLYLSCKKKCEQINAELHKTGLDIVSKGYYNCLTWAAVLIALMCFGVEYLAGPFTLISAIPLCHLHRKLKKASKTALDELDKNQNALDKMIEAHQKTYERRALEEAKRFLSAAKAPHPVVQQVGVKRGKKNKRQNKS